MAQHNNNHHLELPQLLVLGPPSIFRAFEDEFTRKFNIHKPYESPVPTDVFLDSQAQSVEALLCSAWSTVNADVLRHLPSLRLVVTPSTGVNHIDLSECRRRGISVTSAGSIFAEEVAEIAIGLLIDVLRRISAADRFVRGGLWAVSGDYYPLGTKIGGKRVGLVGLGSIGSEVAKRLEAFGCSSISYHSKNQKPSVSYPFYPNISELAFNSDVLIICCSLSAQTHHMINKHVLSALGKDGVVVNVARGAIIDEKELVRCLVEGEIAGAGMEVFENEPEVPRELMELDNVVMQAHRAACTDESFHNAFENSMANLDAFFCNKPLLYRVI